MIRFTLFGIPVEIQPWFWVTLAFFGGALRASKPEQILAVLLFVLAGFISILVHEFGHALTGRRHSRSTSITLHAFGGYATFPGARLTRGQDLLVTAAGPAIQIALGGLAFLVLKYAPLPSPMVKLFVANLALVSIFWAILNLIPVIPLDGGRLMAATLGPRNHEKSLRISMVVAVAAAALVFYFLKSFIFPLFLGMMALENWKELKQRRGY